MSSVSPVSDPFQSTAGPADENRTDDPRGGELPSHQADLGLATQKHHGRSKTEPARPEGREDELVDEGQRRGDGFHRLAGFWLTTCRSAQNAERTRDGTTAARSRGRPARGVAARPALERAAEAFIRCNDLLDSYPAAAGSETDGVRIVTIIPTSRRSRRSCSFSTSSWSKPTPSAIPDAPGA